MILMMLHGAILLANTDLDVAENTERAQEGISFIYPSDNHPIIVTTFGATLQKDANGSPQMYKMNVLVGMSDCPKYKIFTDNCVLLKDGLSAHTVHMDYMVDLSSENQRLLRKIPRMVHAKKPEDKILNDKITNDKITNIYFNYF